MRKTQPEQTVELIASLIEELQAVSNDLTEKHSVTEADRSDKEAEAVSDGLSGVHLPYGGHTQSMSDVPSVATPTLRALYRGELYPAAEVLYAVPGYREASHAADKTNSRLLSCLEGNPTACAAFDELDEARAELASIDNFEMFRIGFGLGVRLVTEGLLTGCSSRSLSNGV